MHPTVDFLLGLRRQRARLCYILNKAAERLGFPAGVRNALRSGVAGPFQSGTIVADFRPGTIDAWTFHPLFERATRVWIDTMLPDKAGVMLDVGAYCGSYTLRHRQQFEKVFAFEPFPANFHALTENIRLSKAGEVVPVNRAASSNPGKVRLYLATPDTLSLVPVEDGRYVEVEAVTLDEFLSEAGVNLGDVRLIKVDVEGAELSVLEGSRRILTQGSPILVLEANSDEQAEALRVFLTEFGFVENARLDGRNFIFRKSAAHAVSAAKD